MAQGGIREGVRRSLGSAASENWGRRSSPASGPCCVPLPFGAGLVIYFRRRETRKVCATFGEQCAVPFPRRCCVLFIAIVGSRRGGVCAECVSLKTPTVKQSAFVDV